MIDTRSSTSVLPSSTQPSEATAAVRGARAPDGDTTVRTGSRGPAVIAAVRLARLFACGLIALGPAAPLPAADDPTSETTTATTKSKRSHIQPVGEVVAAARHQDTLGLRLARASEVLRQQLALGRGAGLVVEDVVAGSIAEQAGIRQHDVLVLLDDQMLLLPEQLAALLEATGGDTVPECTLLRGGMKVKVVLAPPDAAGRPTLARSTPAATAPVLTTQPPADRSAASAVRTAAKPSPGPGLRPAASALAIVQPREAAAPRQTASPATSVPPPATAARRGGPAAPATAVTGGPAGEETLLRQDADCQIKLSRGAQTRLVVVDARGRILFNDQIDSPETRALVPAIVRERVEEMERSLEARPPVYEVGRLDTPPVEIK